ncbi:MAG: hypothetical protein SCJ93_10305 [Bacillota bacterium]|nr:hypothetical protein [Bacillota bacterium]
MNLNKNEKRILGYIREGRNTLADFTDNLGVSAPEANNIAEKLEKDGFIVKKSYTGQERFNFLLTDEGVEKLSDLTEDEKELLSNEGINMSQLKILKHTKENPNIIAAQIAEKIDIPAMELISDLRYLVDRGMLKEKGILRRKVEILPKGEEVITKYQDRLS